jgi:hypothetical protein
VGTSSNTGAPCAPLNGNRTGAVAVAGAAGPDMFDVLEGTVVYAGNPGGVGIRVGKIRLSLMVSGGSGVRKRAGGLGELLAGGVLASLERGVSVEGVDNSASVLRVDVLLLGRVLDPQVDMVLLS